MKMVLAIAILLFLFISLILSFTKLRKSGRNSFLLIPLYLGSGSVFGILSHYINSEQIQLVLSWGFPVIIGIVMLLVAYCGKDLKRKKE